MPSGYAWDAYQAKGGLDWESRYLIGEFSGSYDNGRKTTDYTINNFRGHDRELFSFVGYRLQNRSFLGGGLTWTQLVSSNYPPGPNYAKANFFEKHLSPLVGGGYDYLSEDFSMRLQGTYILPAIYECDAGSCATSATHKVQGALLSMTLPSPIDGKHHWFWRNEFEFFHFNNVGVNAGGGVGGTASFQLMYRF
jgi:hypothetical protein